MFIPNSPRPPKGIAVSVCVGLLKELLSPSLILKSYHTAPAAAGARLQIRKIRLHASDLPLDLAALGGGLRAEEQEFLVVAADRMGIGGRAREFGALAIGGRLELSAAVRRRGDRRLQTRAVGALGKRAPGGENASQSRRGRHESPLRQKSPPAEAARHANHRRLHSPRIAPELRRPPSKAFRPWTP